MRVEARRERHVFCGRLVDQLVEAESFSWVGSLCGIGDGVNALEAGILRWVVWGL